jgi:hypothetical protein
MNREQLNRFRKSLKRVRAKHGNTSLQARKFLQEAGIHTPSGKLTAKYR